MTRPARPSAMPPASGMTRPCRVSTETRPTMDDEEIFTASFPAGRKQIFVDVKENNIGKYLKIKERGDSQTNSILIPGGSIVQLRNALDEAVQALGLDSGKGGGGGVVKAEVQMSRAGRSQGWGLVEFASAAE